jgi:hypothetical protein
MLKGDQWKSLKFLWKPVIGFSELAEALASAFTKSTPSARFWTFFSPYTTKSKTMSLLLRQTTSPTSSSRLG